MADEMSPWVPPGFERPDLAPPVGDPYLVQAGKGTRRRRILGGRHKRYVVRVSDVEEGYLRRLALAHRVSVQRLLVESTMAAGAGQSLADRRAVIANLFGLYRLAANIANNVNQIAKVANATGEIRAELAATLDAARRVAVRIDAQIDELSLSRRGGGAR